MLFHGTTPSACEGICKSDFMVKLAGLKTGALFGPGIYFGENSSKSDEYAQKGTYSELDDVYAMLLCRVTCGRMLRCEEAKPDPAELTRRCTNSEFHSVLGDREKVRGTYREFIVFNNDQAYPEYVLLYRRQTAPSG